MPIVLERETRSVTAPRGALPAVRRAPTGHPDMILADLPRPDDDAWAEARAARQERPARPDRGRVLGPRVG